MVLGGLLLTTDIAVAQERTNQKEEDAETLSDLKGEKRATKAKAKDAQRVEREASDASAQSRKAYRNEKKAQRDRKKADAQAKKAAKAREKSDEN